jgi:hypothetical protein
MNGMNGASRLMHRRVIVAAAAGIVMGILSQAHWFDSAQYVLAAAQEFASVAASRSEPSKTETGDISQYNPVAVDRSRSLEERTFIIAASVGYGTEECLGEGGGCGKVVADSWCEMRGQGAALSFGQAREDLDGFSRISSPVPRRYFITCEG